MHSAHFLSVVAKDITRRLIPDAERVNGYVLTQIARDNDATAKQHASAAAVYAAYGKPHITHNGKPSVSDSFDGFSWEAHAGGNVTFKLYSVEPEKVARLTAALKAIL